METNYLIIIGLLFAFYAYRLISARQKRIRLKALMDSGESFELIDVRTAGEFAAGHIPGARNIPVETIGKRAGKMAKDKPVVLYCQSGSRAVSALATLKNQGFSQAWNFGRVGNWRGKLER